MLMKKHEEVFGILKESLKIPSNNPKFVLLTFLTSLPLVFIMLLHEIILQKIMIETKTYLTPPPLDPDFDDSISFYNYWPETLYTAVRFIRNMSPKIFKLGLLYFVPLHLLDLINTITTINSASAIYTKQKPVKVKEMLLKLKSFNGPLITSVYVLSLNCFVLAGLFWSVTNSIVPSLGNFFVVVYGSFSVVLLVKWMEWSAIWNVSIVISVLEDCSGIEAFWVSGYYSRANKRCGLYLMLVFFAWRTVLRLACVYLGGSEKWSALAITSLLSCVGNVMKWVVCTVYFYDCKNNILGKKVDVEEGS